MIWTKDGGGFLNYMKHDLATGAVVETITDVNTFSDLFDQGSGLPDGWSTPAGGGANLTTTMVVDGLGRTTKLTDPSGRVTYTVYCDYCPSSTPWVQEVFTYPGWNAPTQQPTGPTQVVVLDRAHGFTDTLTTSVSPVLDANGVPTGGEFIASMTSLSAATSMPPAR